MVLLRCARVEDWIDGSGVMIIFMWSLQYESRREEGHGVASHGLGPHRVSLIKVRVLCWRSDIAEEEKASSFT